MAKSLKSLLSKINLVDVVVVLVLIAVLMCLMKKMDVVEGLCMANEIALENNDRALYSGDKLQWYRLCSNKSVQECNTINIETGEYYDPSSIGNSSGCILDSDSTSASGTPETQPDRPNCERWCCGEFTNVNLMLRDLECSGCITWRDGIPERPDDNLDTADRNICRERGLPESTEIRRHETDCQECRELLSTCE